MSDSGPSGASVAPWDIDIVRKKYSRVFASLKGLRANPSLLVVGALFSYGIACIGQIALAHFIPKNEVGYMSFGSSALGALGFLGFTGVNTAAIGSMSRNRMGVYRQSWIVQLAGSAVLSCLILVAALVVRHTQPDKPTFFSVLLVQAVLVPWTGIPIWGAYLTARSRFDLLLGANAAISVSSLIALLLVGLAGGNGPTILIGKYLPAVVFGLGLSTAIFWKLRDRRDVEPGWFRYGLLRTSFSILGLLVVNLDKLLVGAFISFEALASVVYAEYFYSVSASIFKAIESGYSPRIAVISDGIALRRFVHRHAKILAVPLLVWALAIIASLPLFVKLVLPPEYQDVAKLGQAYMLAWIMSIPSMLLSPIIWTHHLGRTDLKVTTNLHLTRLAAMVILLPTLGVIGLPLSRAITNIANFFLLRREVRLFTS